MPQIDERFFLGKVLPHWRFTAYERGFDPASETISVFWDDVECVVPLTCDLIGSPHTNQHRRPYGYAHPYIYVGGRAVTDWTKPRAAPQGFVRSYWFIDLGRFQFWFQRSPAHADFQRTLNRTIAQLRKHAARYGPPRGTQKEPEPKERTDVRFADPPLSRSARRRRRYERLRR